MCARHTVINFVFVNPYGNFFLNYANSPNQCEMEWDLHVWQTILLPLYLAFLQPVRVGWLLKDMGRI